MTVDDDESSAVLNTAVAPMCKLNDGKLLDGSSNDGGVWEVGVVSVGAFAGCQRFNYCTPMTRFGGCFSPPRFLFAIYSKAPTPCSVMYAIRPC